MPPMGGWLSTHSHIKRRTTWDAWINKPHYKKYHIEFGKPKSNKMKRARKNTGTTGTLGNMELEVADKYKYLGQIINHKGNLMDHLKMVKGKTEAAYQRILSIAGSATFCDIEMEVIWRTISTNILPIVTYSGEVWKTTKKRRNK